MNSAHMLNATALDPAKSVVVSACAGSGKTWLLVSRILRALLAGAKPGEILAITFTRKAAREMQSRLTEWLKLLATADDATVARMLIEREAPPARVQEWLPLARGLYESLLTAEPPVTITTFHSWFLQLARRAPLDAGVAADAMLTEETSALMQEAWQRFAAGASSEVAKFLDELYTGHGPDATRRLLTNFLARRTEWRAYAGNEAGDGDDAAAIARALAALREGMPVAPGEDVAAGLMNDSVLVAQLAEFAALLARNGTRDQVLAEALNQATGQRDAARWFALAARAFVTGEGDLRQRKPSGAQAKRLTPQGETRYLALHQTLGQRFMDARAALQWQRGYCYNVAALNCGAALARAYQSLKAERRVIDYADIEWQAYRLTADPEHAAYLMVKLDARYRHVLLDEFQDTNPLQWLTLKHWFNAAAEADARPSVFVVGDPKQSIYRFRRAEARLFDEASAWLAEHFGAVALSQDESRRCAPAVLEVVNRVFAAEQGFPGFREHSAHHPAKPGLVRVLPLLEQDEASDVGPMAWRDPLQAPLLVPEDSRRAREAQQLAQGLRDIVGQWRLADDDAGKVGRPACYGDILILVRRRTHLAAYEDALRRTGVPYVTSRQGGLLDTLEARDLMALLAFLVSPFDDLKFAHALRSPVFGAGDDDLVCIARVVGRPRRCTWWQALSTMMDDDAGPVLARARRLFTAWLDNADKLPVHDLLDRIYFEADVLRRYHDAVPPAMRGAVAANLNAFMHRALDADAGRYLSLPRFVADLAALRDAPAVEAPDEGLIGDTRDAVRILTVHGAKGLEAPIVWLPDAAAMGASHGGHEVLIDWPANAERPEHFSMAARRDEQTPLQRAMSEAEGDLARRENLNLLYVAMTRTKQALIVSGIAGRGSDVSWHQKIADASTGSVEAVLDAEKYQQKQLLTIFSPVQVAGDARLNAPLPTGMRQAAVAESAAMRHGTRFHALMERLTAATAAPDKAALQSTLAVDDAEFDALWRDAQRVLNDTQWRRYFDAALYVRASNEVSLVGAQGELLRIDRLVEFDDSVCVLDYKTGALDRTDAALLEAYRVQVRSYCVHIAGVFAGKQVQGLILFTGGGSIDVTLCA